ncbi:MAG: DeoR/GlpR family DNA-binding transcription regulator [Chitinophagaceae bacterium]
MLKEERLRWILGRVEQDKKVLLYTLSEELGVSEDTVRRDIRELSDQGLLKMVRGGAVPHAPDPRHFTDRIHIANKDKQAIAHKAISLLHEGQVVIFDGGTSTLAVASILPKNLKITVVTNSFPVASMLENHENAEVLFAGGRLFKDSFVTVGFDTIRFFQNIRADICFLGICSIHLQLGITSQSYEESEVKKTIVSSSVQVVALTTLEKIDTAESFYICPATSLNAIITTSPGHAKLEPFNEAGISIL